VSSSKFPSYQHGIRNINQHFDYFPQGFSIQNHSPENFRHQAVINQKTVDSTSRKPLQFSGQPDSTISESIVNKQVVNLPDRQYHLPGHVRLQDHSQQLISSNTENPSTLHQNRFVKNAIPLRINKNQDVKENAKGPSVEENFGNRLPTANPQFPGYSPSSEHRASSVLAPNVSSQHNREPSVQLSQSIEASEHHSIYHAPDNLLDTGPPPSAIRITKAPNFGQAARQLSEDKLRTTSAQDTRQKMTLKDILVEDCPKAKETGYCSSPPRYPS
jgi:hypothetical protein